MIRILCCGLAVLLCAGCSLSPKVAPAVTQYDVGNDFTRPAGRRPLPLRGMTVNAAPMVAGLAMYYREPSQPTLRGVYAFSRWAVPPANLVDQALVRLLPVSLTGSCHLNLLVSDVILDVGSEAEGRLLLAAEASVSMDRQGPAFRQVLDVGIPVARVSPAAEAEGLHSAILALADRTEAWIASDPGIAESCGHAD